MGQLKALKNRHFSTRSAKTLADRVRAEPEADYMINQHGGCSIEPCTYDDDDDDD